MIEFKADCGHTVRARDDDAGGAVRCSYCGKTVAVPESGEGNLDYLFRDVQAQEAPEPRRKWKWRARKPAARPSKPGEINPFGIVVRLCYFALLIIIVIVLGDKFVLPMFNSEERARRMSGVAPTVSSGAAPSENSGEVQSAKADSSRGLLGEAGIRGLYVSSIPRGATAFVIEEAKAPKSGRINQISGAHSLRTDESFSRLGDGVYVVEVALPWNDPGLNDPSLPGYADYLGFRRALERASDSQRKQLQDDYFLPDEAGATFVSEADDLIYFIRQYRGVAVQQGRSKGVRALFLPRLGKSAERLFSIELLLVGYIPPARKYGFDDTQVRAELKNFYEVPGADQQAIMDALARIGAIAYAGLDGKVRMFKIDIHDGGFAARVIREGNK